MFDVKIFLLGCIKISLSYRKGSNKRDQGLKPRRDIKNVRNSICQKVSEFRLFGSYPRKQSFNMYDRYRILID